MHFGGRLPADTQLGALGVLAVKSAPPPACVAGERMRRRQRKRQPYHRSEFFTKPVA